MLACRKTFFKTARCRVSEKTKTFLPALGGWLSRLVAKQRHKKPGGLAPPRTLAVIWMIPKPSVAQGPLAYVAARKRKATPRSRFYVGIARRTQAGDPTVRGHVCDRN